MSDQVVGVPRLVVQAYWVDDTGLVQFDPGVYKHVMSADDPRFGAAARNLKRTFPKLEPVIEHDIRHGYGA